MSIELLALRGVMAIGALAAAFAYGVSYSNDKHALKRAEAVEHAREQEEKWQTDVEALSEVKDDEIRRIAADRDAALRSLRNRPAERMPEASSCSSDGKGATGAQLSEPDAAVLTRLAAYADATAADLRACQAWVETVTRAASQ